jgi:hypothetical protein
VISHPAVKTASTRISVTRLAVIQRDHGVAPAPPEPSAPPAPPEMTGPHGLAAWAARWPVRASREAAATPIA